MSTWSSDIKFNYRHLIELNDRVMPPNLADMDYLDCVTDAGLDSREIQGRTNGNLH